MMEMPKPTAEHRKLERFAGIWTGKEKMYPSQWDPKGGTATAHAENKIALSGFIVAGDYTQKREGKTTFEGHSVLTYDANQKTYLLHWWDSMGMGEDIFRGNFEGERMVLTSKNPQGQFRLSYDFPKPGKMNNKMEMSQDGKTWKAFMDCEWTRED